MMWGWNGWSWWGWLLMTLSMLAFWGLVIWGIVALFRRPGDDRHERPDPERILAERFAAGQLDEQEYRRRLEVLRDRTVLGARGRGMAPRRLDRKAGHRRRSRAAHRPHVLEVR